MISLEDYTRWTDSTAVYPQANTGSDMELAYLGLGLAGEAGEVSEKIKKKLRDGHLDTSALEKELGDVFWYLVRIAKAAGLNPQMVIEKNIAKLQSRKERGVLQGSGDNR